MANSYHDKNSRHDKKLVFKFGKYIYHRYIYISRPPCERNRQTDVKIVREREIEREREKYIERDTRKRERGKEREG